ncbi:unnamed protein product [Urochloa decumbens]|uniref:Uncharacterized protein n=1 Tax=Urochloa decumbens TaxID=240449 RepID=A0ABC9AGQ8_9POAL
MANFAVDPRPFVPRGFTLQHHEVPREPVRMRSFLAFSVEKNNEDLAIAITEPRVAVEDFWPFARELRRFLLDNQRESFVLGGPFPFNEYQIRFIHHDEGPNMKDLELDRSVWLLLLCFPSDAKNLFSLVDKSLPGFGQLLHVHRSSNESRLVVRVLVNKDADVPDSVTLSVGTYPRVRTWTVPVFVLSATDVILGGDEEPLPDGPTHPLPNPAPGWMGPLGAHAAGGNLGDAVADAFVVPPVKGKNGEPAVHGDQTLPSGKDSPAKTVSVKMGQQSPFSGASADFAASGGVKASPKGPSTFLNQVICMTTLSLPPLPITSCPFRTLSLFIIDLDTKLPSYLVDKSDWWYLAKVVEGPEEFGGAMKCKLEGTEASDGDDELRFITKEEATPRCKSTRKRRAKKMRTPLSKEFVRRSTRLNKELQGYRNKASVVEPVDEMEEAAAEVILEPTLLAVIPVENAQTYVGTSEGQSDPAPFLSIENGSS